MVNWRISEDIKECALRLWNYGWDVEDVPKLSASREAAAIAGDRYSKNMALSKDRHHPSQDVLVQSRPLYCQLFKICLQSMPICFLMKCVHGWRLSTTSSSVFLHFPVS